MQRKTQDWTNKPNLLQIYSTFSERKNHLDLCIEDSIWPNSRKISVIRRHTPGNLPDLKIKLKVLCTLPIYQIKKKKKKNGQCCKGYSIPGTLHNWKPSTLLGSVNCMTTLGNWQYLQKPTMHTPHDLASHCWVYDQQKHIIYLPKHM